MADQQVIEREGLVLSKLQKGDVVYGILPGVPVTVVSVDIGNSGANIVFKTPDGRLDERMLFPEDLPNIRRATTSAPWTFSAPAADFQLATEAYRIKLAHLFDPMMAVHTSDVEPLPHQISAVYEAMLPRQPLRFVLADDPGAGKTIMAGLLIRELLMRADARRILIVSPGSLTGQWQDELREKFGLDFTIFSRELQELSSGNVFAEQERLIARLDQLSRNEDYKAKLKATHWDLIIVDEAHKLSASYYGNEVKKTQRFMLGELLGGICRHFLLMTATPHNGKEADFQAFLSLLDGDRFYGRFREGAHKVDVTDLMRRMVKEELLRFDGTRLFPERRAYTANYELSDREAALYAHVTTYVREEMNRAEKLLDKKRTGTVGFALTQLQRRLASSPEAIFQSLRRRRRRLEERLEEMKLIARGQRVNEDTATYKPVAIDVPDDLDEVDEELSADDYEVFTEQVVDQATASATVPELEAEIFSLRSLETEAKAVVDSKSDHKWDQLSRILQDNPLMWDAEGNPRKIIIFTEHRDTLNYLCVRIRDLLGREDAVITIHGGVNRDDRRKVQERFRQDRNVRVLVATDAAGEGVNLQNANLMVNYDLPWNPNRLEQRFGRIHRIGQREVCHLWNLVARETREGEVFQRLFEKIEIERQALGGRVFDVLGEAFDNVSLRELLVEAIRYGERPDIKARLFEVLDNTLETSRLKDIYARNALAQDHLELSDLYAIKEEMDRAEARKLQPHFIRAFFGCAFERLCGELRPREPGRFEVPHVPAVIRERDRILADTRTPVLRSYHRICFEKQDVRVDGKPMADLIHPAHPLMSAVIDLTLQDRLPLLKQGSILVDENDPGTEPRLLLLLEHAVKEGSGEQPRIASQRLQFVSVRPDGSISFAGYAPHLDLRPASASEQQQASDLLQQPWLSADVERQAVQWASAELVPTHYSEVRTRCLAQIDKVHAAVRARLTKEINHLTYRAQQLKLEAEAGRQPKVQPANLERSAEELSARLESRERELEAQRHIVSVPPRVIGGALVLPAGLLGQAPPGDFSADPVARARIERLAMEAVMAAERRLGNTPRDVSADKCGWDITSRPPTVEGRLQDDRLIEVKGRAKGAPTITLTKNEILAALNKPEQFWLAVVLVGPDDSVEGPYYLQGPVTQAPDWAEVSKTLDLQALLSQALQP